jgi:PPE family
VWPFDREVAGEAHAAFDHKTVYNQLQSGNGPSQLSNGVASWQTKIGGQFDEAHGLLTTGLKTASAEWEGAASDAMQGDVSPMAQFVLDAKEVSHSVGQTTQAQADHFADVKAKMPPPVEVTATDNWLSRGWSHLTGGQTDAEAQEQQAMEASDKAAGVYADYRNNANSATVPQYSVVPQSNGVDAAPQQQPGGPVPYKGSDSYQPGPNSGPYSTHIGTLPGSSYRSPSGPPGGQQPPVGAPPGGGPTEIQHYPVGGPPVGGPPGGLPIEGPPTGQPPVGSPPLEPLPFYGPPGAGDLSGSGGSRGGASSGFGGRAGAGAGSSNALGRGGSAGAGAIEEGGPGARAAVGAAGKPGISGGQGMPGAGGRGKSKDEEDKEHLNKFMEPTDEHWGTGEKTVPPVIGDPGYQL